MKKILDLVTQHHVIFLIASLIFALPFISFAPFVKTVDNVDYFTLEDDPDVEFYNEFKKVFGNDEFFVITFEKEDIFTSKNLTLLKNITEELETIDEVREIKSLANVDDTIGGPDYFEVKEFLQDIPEDGSELAKLKEQAVSNPLYVKNLISPDARTAAIMVSTYDRPDDEDYRKRLIEKCEKILDHYRKDVNNFYLAGWTTTNFSLSQYLKKDMATFIPITYLLIILSIFFFFRNVRLTLLAIANISVCMGCTMGLFSLTGITHNNVTAIVPPLVMALALCDTVHIFSHMKKSVLSKFPDKRKALASVLKRVVMPCFLTTLTTAIGFLSLTISEIPPIREFALLASAGMVFEFIFSFFFLPPLILFFAPEKIYKDHGKRGMSSFLGHINGLVQSHSRFIVLLSLVVVIIACFFTSKIGVETNLVDFFKKNSPVRTAIDFVEKRLSGVGSLDISLQTEQEDGFKIPANLQAIDTLQQYIKSLKGVDVTISFVDFIKDMNESFHEEDPDYYTIPETRKLVSQYLLLYDSDDIEDFINETYDHARISVRISEHSTAGQENLIANIERFIEKMNHSGINIRITGRAVQDVNTIDALVKGQVYSLTIAAGVIFVIMFLVLKSFAIGCLSLIPNLFPIVLNFGIMGIAGIPLNTATALIAVVALGIAVDDTIHFLSEYREKRAKGITISEALNLAILVKGRAIVLSSLILCIGFGVMVLSRFVPIINFGMLTAIIMISAVIGDLVVLPSVLLLKRPDFFPSSTPKNIKDKKEVKKWTENPSLTN